MLLQIESFGFLLFKNGRFTLIQKFFLEHFFISVFDNLFSGHLLQFFDELIVFLLHFFMEQGVVICFAHSEHLLFLK